MSASAHTPSSPRIAMGIAFSSVEVEAALPSRASPLSELHEELLASILSFLPARDVEALTVASKTVAFDVVPRFPIWKQLFCHRWSTINYELQDCGVDCECPIEIDERVKSLLPPNCSESRMFQLLAHAITPVPSFADIRETERARHFSLSNHVVAAIDDPPRKRTLDIAYTGSQLGGDRCVRANVPFAPTFRVAVYAAADAQTKKRKYCVGVTASGYFEMTIRKRKNAAPAPKSVHSRGMGRWRTLLNLHSSEMSAIGIATSSFPLVSRQPGWDAFSIGYHGDDGNIFNRYNRGEPFATPFGAGDTVGCGVRRDVHTGQSFVYFTNNGDVIPTGDRQIPCMNDSWYPVVGLDSFDVVHVNFGQEPFVHAEAVDELFEESAGQTELIGTQLSWYDISDSDGESVSSSSSSRRSSSASALSSSDQNGHDHEDEDGDMDDHDDFEMMYDQLSDMSDFAEFLDEYAEDLGMGDE